MVLTPSLDMRQHDIHRTPEERQASNTEKTFNAVTETTQSIKDLHGSLKDKSDIYAVGYKVDRATQTIAQGIDELKDYIDHPEVVVRKIEEVKSASLITNKHLKNIEKAVSREPEKIVFPAFPRIPEVDLKPVKDGLTALSSMVEEKLDEVVDEMKKPWNVKLTLKLVD